MLAPSRDGRAPLVCSRHQRRARGALGRGHPTEPAVLDSGPGRPRRPQLRAGDRHHRGGGPRRRERRHARGQPGPPRRSRCRQGAATRFDFGPGDRAVDLRVSPDGTRVLATGMGTDTRAARVVVLSLPDLKEVASIDQPGPLRGRGAWALVVAVDLDRRRPGCGREPDRPDPDLEPGDGRGRADASTIRPLPGATWRSPPGHLRTGRRWCRPRPGRRGPGLRSRDRHRQVGPGRRRQLDHRHRRTQRRGLPARARRRLSRLLAAARLRPRDGRPHPAHARRSARIRLLDDGGRRASPAGRGELQRRIGGAVRCSMARPPQARSSRHGAGRPDRASGAPTGTSW